MNILDYSPQEFEDALVELQLAPEREQFLRDEYAKKNTISGQMLGSFQEAIELPEGRVRAELLPFTKPEGMTGWEAIKSGEAELALPGAITGAVEEIGKAATTGEKMGLGLGVSKEEIEQAGITAGTLLTGNALKAPLEYDPTKVNIFGGYDVAHSPGTSIKGEDLPLSKGIDEKLRFEIDDSMSVVFDLDTLTPVKDWKSVPFATTRLGDVLAHEELYYHYPDLKDIKVVVDESLGASTLGWALPKEDIIALSGSVIDSPESAHRTLIHEIQHIVQEREGFTSGTNLPKKDKSGNIADTEHEVYKVAKLDIDSPENIEQWDRWKKDFASYQDVNNAQVPIVQALNFIEEVAESRGLTLDSLIRLREPSFFDKARQFFRPLPDKDRKFLLELSLEAQSLKDLSKRIEDGNISFAGARGWVNSVYNSLVEPIEGLGEAPKFETVFGIGVDTFKKDVGWSSTKDKTPPYEVFFPEPKMPDVPSPDIEVPQLYLHSVYERKAGEQEARAAADRLKFSLDERFFIDPDFMDKEVRELNWTSPEKYSPPKKLFNQNYAEGGMVEDEQMNRLMAEGGLVDPKDNAVFRHHLENVRTGNSVKNEDGTVSTIRTIIMGDGENEYLIPTVWDGRILSDEEAFDKAMKSGIDWPKAPAGEKGVAYLEDLDKQIHSLPGFANGGLTTERQMNRLMAEGGMTDDGMTREPVTGNEIPPGSMASEVRDDIPAQLSEGEYIVPADVVRFFGVRFFEELRNQAKQGLAEMDAEGRIGGAKVDANGVPMEADEELTPEEEQMLMEALGQSGMAYGGMVQAQSMANPYKDQPTTYQAQGMADGGLTNPEFDRTKFKLEPTATGGFETRKYINPQTGEERSFQFLNGMALGAIPDGFVPWTQELADQVKEVEEAPVKKTRPESRDDSDENNFAGEDNLDKWASDNYEKLSADPFSFGMEALNKTGIEGFAGKAGKVPGAIGLAAKAASTFSRVEDISDAIASLNEMEARGLQGTEEYAELSSSIEKAREDIGVGGFVGAGAQKIIDATARRKTSVYTTYGTSFSPATTATAPTTASRSSEESYFGSDDYQRDLAVTQSHYERASSGDTSAIGPDYDPYEDSSIWDEPSGSRPDPEPTSFSAAKGGLVAKKTKQRKPRKTTKGLASDK